MLFLKSAEKTEEKLIQALCTLPAGHPGHRSCLHHSRFTRNPRSRGQENRHGQKKYTVAACNSANIYRAADTLTIVVNGLTGKIKSAGCYQAKRDVSIFGFLSKDGIKCCQKGDDCACSRSNCTLNLGLSGISRFKLSFKAITVICYYKLYNDGALKYMDDLIKVCRKGSYCWTVDSKGNIIKTIEKR